MNVTIYVQGPKRWRWPYQWRACVVTGTKLQEVHGGHRLTRGRSLEDLNGFLDRMREIEPDVEVCPLYD